MRFCHCDCNETDDTSFRKARSGCFFSSVLRNDATSVSVDPMQLSTTEAARRTGIPLRTIQWAITQGHLPAQRLGTKMWMIDPTELDAWAAAHNEETT